MTKAQIDLIRCLEALQRANWVMSLGAPEKVVCLGEVLKLYIFWD